MSSHSDLLALARRVVWFKDPEETVKDRAFFLAHIMTYGTLDDVLIARHYFTSADFRDALDHAPAGVFDPRSWAYWNTIYGHPTPRPLPRRLIGDASPLA